MIVADYDSAALKKLETKLGGDNEDGRLSFVKIDVKNHDETSAMLRGNDFLINAVQYYYNLDVMAAALNARVSYLDFGGLFHATLKQIEQFDEKFREAGILGIAGMGGQPGVSNLMAKYAAQDLERIDSIEIIDGWRDFTKSDSPIYFTWSPQTFFDESSQEAVTFEDGRYVRKPPFSDSQKIKLPEPVGEVDVYLSLHSELATLPKFFERKGLKNLFWKEGGADFWKIKLLADLGLTSNKKFSIDDMEIEPRRFLLKLLESKNMVKIQEDAVPDDYEITRVVARGFSSGKTKRRKKKTVVVVDAHFPPYKPWKASCSQYNVGVPGSIAAQLVASDPSRFPKGVLPAEQVFDPREFFKELEKRKIVIRKRTI